MTPISFEQFIKTFNFRAYRRDCDNEMNAQDTYAVRFYLGDYDTDDWFEYGVWDYGVDTWDIVQRSLHPNVTNSYVSEIKYNEDVSVLEVHLTSVETREEMKEK